MKNRAGDREGGVKIVFDVLDRLADETSTVIAAGGFRVDAYCSHPKLIQLGGAATGFVRLGAERPSHRSTDAELDATLAAFETIVSDQQLDVTIIGVDTWGAN